MIKLIGMIFIMCAGCGFGFSMASKLKRHIEVLELIDCMFTETIIMIQFNAVTFGELTDHLKRCPQIGRLKFLNTDLSAEDIRECITESLKKNEDRLDREEVSQLCGFFLQFGTSDLEGQLLMAKKYHEFFRQRIKKLKEESAGKSRMYKSLGVLGGAFMAVMLI